MSTPLCDSVKTVSSKTHKVYIHFMIYTLRFSCYNRYRTCGYYMDSDLSIEQRFIDQISGNLVYFSRQSNAYRFLCPYCQSSGKDSKGKPYAPGGAKGFLYQKNNAWNFICHRSDCESHTLNSQGKSFEKFLADHFPKQHLDYVKSRDQLGLTGFQTNCPTLETLLKKRGELGNPPGFRPGRIHQQIPRPLMPPAAPSAPATPKVTKLPPMRSPQQQAGCQASLNHQMKQREQRRREREGW